MYHDGTPRPPSELTNLQIVLLNWLHYYDWILSGDGPPTPEQDVLDNDEALDDYVSRIDELISTEDSKEHIRLHIAQLVENLNLFEISELLLYYAKLNKHNNE